ncbi:glycosyltransferase [[Eubacterium] hominis]|uniref:glycosyltransferase n=1 Tax=[Eubacterium] hominis TaxID=2764325 RepID=UPI003A4E3E67
MRKKVIYIGGFEFPDKNAAAHRVLSNAKILNDIGNNVIFISIDKSLKKNDIENTFKLVQGFETYAIPYPHKTVDWIRYLTSIRDYVQIINKYDGIEALICYNFPSIALNKLRKFCESKEIKCLADVTEWYSVKGRDLFSKIIKGFDTWYRMRVVHKRLDGLIVISKFLESYYQHYNVISIPPLTDTDEKKWDGNYSKSKSEMNLVYAGNPGNKDRIDILIEALKIVRREIRLDIIGITLEQYIEMYPNHKTFLLSSKMITFHGKLSHLETLEYVKRSNYSCFFRMDDRVSKAGFPTKFVEAISCGTPVITNASSNIKDYMNKGKNGICIDNLNYLCIADTLDKVPAELPVEKDLFLFRRYENEMKIFMGKL